MDQIADIGQVILSSTERRLEITSHNVANASTPGYKRQSSFSDALSAANIRVDNRSTAASDIVQNNYIQTDFSQGDLKQTRNPLDLAISGSGFFQVRVGESLFYTRQGEFTRLDDGSVVNSQGFILQADGGDLILNTATPEILPDGKILENGLPIGRVAIYMPEDGQQLQQFSGSLFAASGQSLKLMEDPVLRQGFLEASNVSMTSEMVAMMSAMRQAETGARIIQVYDDLLGRAITTFGQR